MSNLHQSVVDQVHSRIGKTLKDKWRIDALIGMGGMAAVYSATHRTGSRVALKVLHPALSMNESVRRRFSREGYVANTIDHPSAVAVMDDDVSGESVGLPLAGETGLLIAFPAHVVHSVSPVTAGERYTVVSWFFEDTASPMRSGPT